MGCHETDRGSPDGPWWCWAHLPTERRRLWWLPTLILAGSVSVDWMWFSCSDYFVSHYSNILWLIAFGCAFPSSSFLLKVHCVCQSLSGSGLWQLGFSEVAQITLRWRCSFLVSLRLRKPPPWASQPSFSFIESLIGFFVISLCFLPTSAFSYWGGSLESVL